MKLGIVIVVCFALFSSGCCAWSLRDNKFEKTAPLHHQAGVDKGEPASLSLRGVGVKTLLRVRIFMAALYLKSECNASNVLDGDQPKYLSVKFYVKIPGSEFTKYTISHMPPNVTAAEYEKVKPLHKRMGELFPDIKSGDTLVLDYEPGVGTTFVHNGQERGVIEGIEFSKAIFGTWVGPKPIDYALKGKVLGLKSS